MGTSGTSWIKEWLRVNNIMHLKIGAHFLHHVLEQRKGQCVQEQSSSQEMTCFREHSDTVRVAHLQSHSGNHI